MKRIGVTALLIFLFVCATPGHPLFAQEKQWKKHLTAAESADQQGRYAQAEQLYLAALQEAEKFGPSDLRLATSLNKIASLYCLRFRYAEAEPLLQRALRTAEKALGPEHPDLAYHLSNLAVIYSAQGKYAEAEPLLQRALRISEKTLGPEHLPAHASPAHAFDVLYPPAGVLCAGIVLFLDNLAAVYKEQGKYAEAEPLYQRVLRIEEKAHGPDSFGIVRTLANLAAVYQKQGKYTEAELLYRRALHNQEEDRTFGSLSVVRQLINLAELYIDQGKYAEAEPLLQEALRDIETRGLSIQLNDLAALYEKQGRYAEAEPLYQRALRIQEKDYGPEHPVLADTLLNYAKVLRKTGREGEAAKMETRAEAIRTKHR